MLVKSNCKIDDVYGETEMCDICADVITKL